MPQSPAAGHLLPDSRRGPEPPPPALRAAVRLRPGPGSPTPGSGRGGSHFTQTSSGSTSCLPLRDTSDRHYTNRLQGGWETRRLGAANDLTPRSPGQQRLQGDSWGQRQGHSTTLLPQRLREPTQLPKGPGNWWTIPPGGTTHGSAPCRSDPGCPWEWAGKDHTGPHLPCCTQMAPRCKLRLEPTLKPLSSL